MNRAHGVAVICEREQGHTVAWVDARLSKQIPAGYFTETWPQDGETHVGTLDGGYIIGYDGWGQKYSFGDWYDAVLWCRHAERQRQGT
jgi:hypothetical protein